MAGHAPGREGQTATTTQQPQVDASAARRTTNTPAVGRFVGCNEAPSLPALYESCRGWRHPPTSGTRSPNHSPQRWQCHGRAAQQLASLPAGPETPPAPRLPCEVGGSSTCAATQTRVAGHCTSLPCLEPCALSRVHQAGILYASQPQHWLQVGLLRGTGRHGTSPCMHAHVPVRPPPVHRIVGRCPTYR